MANARALARPRASSRPAARPSFLVGQRSFGPSRGLIPLVHTVRRPPSTVRPLMRTVLRDTNRTFQGSLVRSPVLLARASGRSLGLNKVVARRVSAVVSSPQVSARAFACARRQIRREVILATGRGGGRHRPPSYRSNWRC